MPDRTIRSEKEGMAQAQALVSAGESPPFFFGEYDAFLGAGRCKYAYLMSIDVSQQGSTGTLRTNSCELCSGK